MYLLVFFPDILRSCDRKFVFRFWTPTRCRRSVATVVNIYHRSLYKGKAHCHKSLFFACKGLGNFPKQILPEVNAPFHISPRISELAWMVRITETFRNFSLEILYDLPSFWNLRKFFLNQNAKRSQKYGNFLWQNFHQPSPISRLYPCHLDKCYVLKIP